MKKIIFLKTLYVGIGVGVLSLLCMFFLLRTQNDTQVLTTVAECETIPYKIEGSSMSPLLNDGEIKNFIQFRDNCDRSQFDFGYGDIVLLNVAGYDQQYVKSIGLLPGDKVQFYRYTGNNYFIKRNDERLENSQGNIQLFSGNVQEFLQAYLDDFEDATLPSNTYLFLGENAANSRDGRSFGFMAGENISGILVK